MYDKIHYKLKNIYITRFKPTTSDLVEILCFDLNRFK